MLLLCPYPHCLEAPSPHLIQTSFKSIPSLISECVAVELSSGVSKKTTESSESDTLIRSGIESMSENETSTVFPSPQSSSMFTGAFVW